MAVIVGLVFYWWIHISNCSSPAGARVILLCVLYCSLVVLVILLRRPDQSTVTSVTSGVQLAAILQEVSLQTHPSTQRNWSYLHNGAQASLMMVFRADSKNSYCDKTLLAMNVAVVLYCVCRWLTALCALHDDGQK